MEAVEHGEFQCLYSAIVVAELFSSRLLTGEDKRDLRKLLGLGETVEVDSEVALRAGELRALSRRLYGRKMKLPDALVAATAFLHSATLVTRNTEHFEHLEKHGMILYNPFSSSA